MRSFLILLTVILSGFCQVSHHMDTRSLGVVSEGKMKSLIFMSGTPFLNIGPIIRKWG